LLICRDPNEPGCKEQSQADKAQRPKQSTLALIYHAHKCSKQKISRRTPLDTTRLKFHPSKATLVVLSYPATATATYAYNGDGLRLTAATWNTSSSSTQTAHFAWNTNTDALLSDGTNDFIYGVNANVPIAQVNLANSVTDELLGDTNSNVRGVVELSAGTANQFSLAN
jgi:hypothetical protein